MYRFKSLDYDIIIYPKLDLKKLYVELTSLCNYSCKLCFRQSFTEPLGHMSRNLLEKLLKDIDDFPEIEWVVIGGIGEPLFHPDFRYFITEVKKKNLRISISTNGSLIDDEMVDFLIDIGVERVIFSLETGDIGHKWNRKVIQTIEKLIKRRNLKKSGKPVLGIEFVLTKQNVKDLPKVIDLCREKEVDNIILTNLLPVHDKLVGFSLYENPGEQLHYVEEFVKNSTIRFNLQIPEFTLLTERHCQFVERNAAVIRWDGEVAPCYRFLHDSTEIVYGRKKVIFHRSFGNIMEKSLKNIWISKEYVFFRFKVKNALFPSCTDCKFRDGCHFTMTTEEDCWGNSPSCADCLWWRGIIVCP